MPHSSGGGSHGGGHHGGSHSHSGSGGRSAPRVSTTRFVGARRYSYYDRNNVKQYIYCEKDPAKEFKPHWGYILFYIPFIFAIFAMLSQIVHIPIRVENYDSYILIDDRASLITDREHLMRSLRQFYNDTGVTPAIVTAYHDEWENNYMNLERYAYDLYVRTFTDEKHWLIVYSVPRRTPSNGFVEWRWEGMIGNDVGGMITPAIENSFTAELHNNFVASNRMTIEEAIASAFDSAGKEAQNAKLDLEMIPFALFMIAFIGFHATAMIGLTPKQLRYSKAKYDPDPRDMPITCQYCGSSFILGLCVSCPNCGAPLEIDKSNFTPEPNTVR